MPVSHDGVQRASRHPSLRALRLIAVAALASVLAVGGLAANPQIAAASGKKVVIVVGPAGSNTSNYIYNAKKLASQARSYGATVYEIYAPHATWARVKSLSQGANVFIYLGHGNGYPSPYGAFNKYTKDGLGLDAYDGSWSHKYYGEYYVDHYLNFAPNAVVILNRLCYASGNSEWGAANPTKSTAIKRVDNYGAGFLRTGARAVFAEGISSASYILYGLFKTSRTMKQIFWSDPKRSGAYDFTFSSTRTVGRNAIMDPSSPGRYYRSVIGDLSMTATTWR
ncbi:MAG TPA: hypothetical protein VN773_14140 [Verrucomicrobiae bacterium]|nr:hypothetical protein [Verrucomicrobiae bacterium]